MIEPASFSSGKAFCTVNSVPLTLMLNSLSKCSSVTTPKGTNSPTPTLAKTISIRAFTLETVSNESAGLRREVHAAQQVLEARVGAQGIEPRINLQKYH
jgi:hypothetical protein